jgi:hypothetical protein
MAKPSDFWPNFKKQWYDEETGDLQEPHRTRLIGQGVTLLQITQMEDEVRAEIAEFDRLDRENPEINGETYNDRRLRLRTQKGKIPVAQRIALETGNFDPDRNY